MEPKQITAFYTKKQWKISPRTVLAFLTKNPSMLPSIPNYGDYTIEEDILRVRINLWHNKKRFDLYSNMTGIREISESLLVDLLTESCKPRYRSRDSPPFPANKLCGSKLYGNDRKLYTSVKNSADVCSWKLGNI